MFLHDLDISFEGGSQQRVTPEKYINDAFSLLRFSKCILGLNDGMAFGSKSQNCAPIQGGSGAGNARMRFESPGPFNQAFRKMF